MSPDNAAILCLTLACLGVSCAWWSTVRLTVFQADLLRIRSRLDLAIREHGATADPEYLAVRADIDIMMLLAPHLTPGFLWSFLATTKITDAKETARQVTLMLGVESRLPEVATAEMWLLIRYVLYVALDPPSLLVLVYLTLRGRTEQVAAFFVRPPVVLSAFDRAGTTFP